MKMETKQVLAKAAELARLKLEEKELEQFSKEAEEILELFSQIDSVDTENIEPAFQPLEIKNKLREDKIKKSLTQEQALANTTHKEKGYFGGPKAI